MKTRIIIEVDTTFKKLFENEEFIDVTKDVEQEFHDSIFDMIESYIQNDSFQQEWLDFTGEYSEFEYLPFEDFDSFRQFGSVGIRLIKEEVIE